MKTAISVPDDLFRKVDDAARRMKVSRSQLYAKALAEFLERESDDSITERLNRVYSVHSSKLDPALHNAQLLFDRQGFVVGVDRPDSSRRNLVG